MENRVREKEARDRKRQREGGKVAEKLGKTERKRCGQTKKKTPI